VALLLEENKLLLDQQLSAGVHTDAVQAAAQRGIGEVRGVHPPFPCRYLSFPSARALGQLPAIVSYMLAVTPRPLTDESI